MRFHPRAHRDSALRDERQVVLTEGDTGGEQRRIGRRRTVLLRASSGLDDDLLQLPVDFGSGKATRSAKVPYRVNIRWSEGTPAANFGSDVALPPLGDHDACRAELGEFCRDLEGADRAAGDENSLAAVGR